MSALSFDLRNPETWPDEVGFVPFVGDRYEQGIDGLRVLILGESHYAKDDKPRPSGNAKRRFTISEFAEAANEHRTNRAWGTFSRRCDSIVSRVVEPTPLQAALAWKQVAFANYVQDFAGDGARQRPTGPQWTQARNVFPVLLERLKPNMILALGRQLWDHMPGVKTALPAIAAPRSPRTVWRMDYQGGHALMSWVYHPSWPNDSVATYVHVMQSLLRLAREDRTVPVNPSAHDH